MNRRVQATTGVRVSAVVPFFNDGLIVEEALRSLRDQSRPVDEIVVVDDGSTDPSSLSVLDRLRGTGVTVVRQQNQGPGPARNLGVAHTAGEALLFLDSDDTVAPEHVELALATLADAPADVGFVYPDLQFTGNENRLLVMPPYNLYLLLHRNFCGMGGLVDRAVFEAGFAFRSDRVVGSDHVAGQEDWDLFVRLGLQGIFGGAFHDTPLRYRRWGYSRSDALHESGLHVTRRLHPELDRAGRLVEIKRVWAPALSIVVPTTHEGWAAGQSCDDFEVVSRGEGTVPRVRGRWVLLLGEEATGVLGDGTFVERVLRLAGDGSPAPPLALYPAASGGGWRPLTAPPDRPPGGLLAEGHYYLDWSRGVTTGTSDLAAFGAYLDLMAGPAQRWEYTAETPAEGLLPLSRFGLPLPPPEPPDGAVETRASEVERGFRHHEARPLFMPGRGWARLPQAPGSSHDDAGALLDRAWSGWVPPRARVLYLVVDLLGRATLETAASPEAGSRTATPRQPARLALGQLWELPFPGTACLSAHQDPSTDDVTYAVTAEAPTRAGDGVPTASGDVVLGYVVLGYVPTDFLAGRVPLAEAINAATALVDGPSRLTLPPLVDHTGSAYVEASLAPQPAARPARPTAATDENTQPHQEERERTRFGRGRRKDSGATGRTV